MDTDAWLTPPAIIAALAPFDLDPCSPTERPWPTAKRHLTVTDDGLTHPWDGTVWLNPPYGTQAAAWLCRLADHGNGIALVFARTETVMFFESVWPRANALLFLQGRLTFHRADGTRATANGGAPSVLIAYGTECARRLRSATLSGQYLELNGPHAKLIQKLT